MSFFHTNVLILAINTATTRTEVALLKADLKAEKIIFEKSWPSQRDEMEKVMPAINMAMKNLGRDPFKKLDAVFVVNGPGGFSGLRIGVTIANAFAYSQKIPLFTCSTFEVLKAKIPNGQKAAVVITTGGKNIAVSWKRKIHQMEIEKFAAWAKKNKIQSVVADLRGNQKIPEIEIEKMASFGQAVKVLLKKKRASHQMVEPIYLQKPNITKSKKEIFVKVSS